MYIMQTSFDSINRFSEGKKFNMRLKMKNDIEINKGKVILYKNRFEVRVEAESVWLNTRQMAELFSVDRTNIVRHIHNTYKTKELDKKSTCAKNAQVAKDGSS